MKLVRTGVAALIALAMVIMTGGAMAMYAHPAPVPISGGAPAIVTYTISLAAEPDMQGPPALFTPYFTFTHAGLVQFHFVNQDRTPHSYLLIGLGIQVTPGPFSSLTVVAFLPHGGAYSWISLMPYPGAPVGGTVGVLIVG